MRFQRVLLPWLVLAAGTARAATGSLTVFDDADRNGFDRLGCPFGSYAHAEQSTVHSGTTAIGVGTFSSPSSACWQTPATFSRLNDYDSISFWVNAGPSATQDLAFLLYNGYDIIGEIDLVTVYGAPLPASTWIPLRISLSDLPRDRALRRIPPFSMTS